MGLNNFNFPTPIQFGAGAICELSKALAGFKNPMLVTDAAIKELPFFQKIIENLQADKFNVGVYADFSGNPVKSHVEKGVESFRAHSGDAMVIIGGGAALDVGKAIALMANHSGDLFDYEDGKDGVPPVDKPIPMMIAVPTTAGTGSEVGRASVISDDVTKEKKIIFDPRMLPNLVLADPELCYGLPKHVTAATGVDALTHCIEAYLAKGFHPMCDGIALEGIHLVAGALEKAVQSPNDYQARADMLAASMMGATAFQKGLGINHSCAHALSTVFDLHHGLANSLMLPACMRFNYQVVPEKFDRMAEAAGLGRQGKDFIPWLEKLAKSIGLETKLGALGVEVTDRLIDVAFLDVCHPQGPRPVTKDDFRKLYTEVL